MKIKKIVLIVAITLIIFTIVIVVLGLYATKIIKENEKKTDHDLDGLNNRTEEIFGTNPKNPDTDNEGTNDKDEILNGTNPLGQGQLKPSMFPDDYYLPESIITRKEASIEETERTYKKIYQQLPRLDTRFAENEVIVTFHQDTLIEQIDQFADRYDLIVYSKVTDLEMYNFKIKGGDLADTILEMRKEAIVKSASLNNVFLEEAR